LRRKEGINQNRYYRWSREFLEAGKKRLAGDTVREATSDEVKDLLLLQNNVCGSHGGCHGLSSQHCLCGLASSYSSLILSVNDELKFSLRQSDYSVQLMLTGCIRQTNGGAIGVDICP